VPAIWARDCDFGLDCEAATVIGHGNVALDVARILAEATGELRRTDIARHALEALAESRIREIRVVGRGKPSQAKFTARSNVISSTWGPAGRRSTRETSRRRTSRRKNPQDPGLVEKLSLLRALSQQVTTKRRRCVFRFGLSPVAIRGEGRVQTIAFAQQPSRAIGDIDCGLVFRSVGRRTTPLAGVPCNEHQGVHANIERRGDPDALLARLRLRVARYRDWATIDAAEKGRVHFSASRGKNSCRSLTCDCAMRSAPSRHCLVDV
jgi:ferredoxin--NADP+ reductase